MNASFKRRRGLGRGLMSAGVVAMLCFAVALPGAGVASAAPPVFESIRVAQAIERVSLAQATQIAQERTGGQVLRAETRRDRGRAVHNIRVLTGDGRVRTVRVDAETGRTY